jgi:hypothetical protein
MKKRAQKRSDVDPFAPTRAAFEQMLAWANGDRCPDDHAELERQIEARGREVHRLLLQGRLDRMFADEAERMRRRRPPGSLRERARWLESIFGRVRVRRHGLRRVGQKASRFALDGRLRLPGEMYSMGLRRRMAEETRSQSWDQAVERVDATTGGHVPKRQAEQLVDRAAQDFDGFYAERRQSEPANDTASSKTLLVLSSDGKGVAMRAEALRDATRKQAEEAERDQVRGDPTEVRAARRFYKRMATVTAVWDQVPCERTAEDIVRKLRSDGEPAARTLPRPERKRVAATIQKNLAAGIAEMFDEADRRDPERERPCVALIDGDEDQAEQIEAQAVRRGRAITIVLDLLHVLHYIWLAGAAISRGNAKKTDAWVGRYLYKLLTAAQPLDVIAGIHQAATLAGLTLAEREPVEKCVGYLRSNISYICYPQYLSQGLPIATGVIEGACRHLVQDRLGITGARWGLKSAEAVLRLRALATNGDWDEYWRFHLRKEHDRCKELRAA